ncbi:MAG: hypothetical protein AAF654_02565 [Myxococcota bacterium]
MVSRSWVGLFCGAYRLALPARVVVSVEDDVTIANGRPFDLTHYWGGAERTEAPYAVWIQHDETLAAVAVDRVTQFSSDAPMMAIPPLGQRRPLVFESGFRDGQGLYLVVTALALIELTAEAGYRNLTP